MLLSFLILFVGKFLGWPWSRLTNYLHGMGLDTKLRQTQLKTRVCVKRLLLLCGCIQVFLQNVFPWKQNNISLNPKVIKKGKKKLVCLLVCFQLDCLKHGSMTRRGLSIGLSRAMSIVVHIWGTVNPSSPLVFSVPHRCKFTLCSLRLLYSWEFTAKSHSQSLARNCLAVCHSKVTYVSRELHGHSQIMVSISASILDNSSWTTEVVLRPSCRGSLVGALYHSAFQSVASEARFRRNQVQAHGHKAFVLGTPETPKALLHTVCLQQRKGWGKQTYMSQRSCPIS